MTYEEIFTEVKNKFLSADVSDYKGHLALQVNLTGEGAGVFYAELKDGTLKVEPHESKDVDVKFIINSKDFLNLINGKLDPIFAFTVGRLKVEGDISKAFEIQRLIKNARF